MKRRSFLKMLAGAVAASMLPRVAAPSVPMGTVFSSYGVPPRGIPSINGLHYIVNSTGNFQGLRRSDCYGPAMQIIVEKEK
jgi:hypothetical protein